MTALSPSNIDTEFDTGAGLPPTEKTLLAAARILAAQQREVECESVLTRVIREHPWFMPAYCDLAELQMRHRRIDDAIQTLSVGLRSSSGNAVLLNNLGMCRIIKGDYEDALRAFTRAAGAIPHDSRYRANMAVALGMMGRYEECLSLYEQIISAEDAQHNVAVLYKARNRLLAGTLAKQRDAVVAEEKSAVAEPAQSSEMVRARSHPLKENDAITRSEPSVPPVHGSHAVRLGRQLRRTLARTGEVLKSRLEQSLDIGATTQELGLDAFYHDFSVDVLRAAAQDLAASAWPPRMGADANHISDKSRPPSTQPAHAESADE